MGTLIIFRPVSTTQNIGCPSNITQLKRAKSFLYLVPLINISLSVLITKQLQNCAPIHLNTDVNTTSYTVSMKVCCVMEMLIVQMETMKQIAKPVSFIIIIRRRIKFSHPLLPGPVRCKQTIILYTAISCLLTYCGFWQKGL